MTIPKISTWSLGTLLDGLLPKAGGTMTGALTLAGAPSNDLHASTKKYVDDAVIAGSKLSSSVEGVILRDFTIPSWANVIVVSLNNVACASSAAILLQLGDVDGLVGSGYAGGITVVGTGNTALSTSFNLTAASTAAFNGVYTLARKDTTTWTIAGQGAFESDGAHTMTSGRKSTAKATTLLRVRASGSVLFSAGGTITVSFYP